MYLENRSGVSYRIKTFLEEKCHIVTLSKPAGRDRAVSVKDLHSCRHTFCYYAGLYGIPMNIVQGIVGHMTPEMTKLYSNHASLEAKREKMLLLPDFLNLADGTNPHTLGNCSQDPEIHELLKQLPHQYAEEIKQILEIMIKSGPRTVIELRRQLTG